MKNKERNWSPDGDFDTPYRRAAAEWDARMGSAVVRAKNWRLAFFSSIAFAVFPCIVGLIVLGMQPKAIPHIVDLMHDGGAVYRGPIGKSWETFTPDRQNILFHLRRFIDDTRSLSSDTSIVKAKWEDAYQLILAPAATKLSAYAQANNPIDRSKSERVSVEVTAENPISADSWQIDWRESVYNTKGELLSTSMWRGIFKLQMIKPEKPLPGNPLGLWIEEFDWTKIKS